MLLASHEFACDETMEDRTHTCTHTRVCTHTRQPLAAVCSVWTALCEGQLPGLETQGAVVRGLWGKGPQELPVLTS